MKFYFPLIAATLFFATIVHGGSSTINVDVDIRTRATYKSCKKYAKRIRENVSLLTTSVTEHDKALYLHKIKKNKKKFRKCEKREESILFFATHAVRGASVGVEIQF